MNLELVPESLRAILSKMLSQNPDERGRAEDLIKTCETELAAFLRESKADASRFSPGKQLDQLTRHLPDENTLRLMPSSQQHELLRILSALKQAKGLTPAQAESIDKLERRLA